MFDKRIMVAAFAAACPFILTGCTDYMAPLTDSFGGNDAVRIQNDLRNDAHTTKKEDKDLFVVLTDEAWENSVVNVVKVQPSEGNKLSLEDIRDFLGRNEIPWVQMNLGTDLSGLSPATCYVYLSSDMTYNEMFSMAETFNAGGYSATTLAPDEYEVYRQKGDDIYYAETTYYPMTDAG